MNVFLLIVINRLNTRRILAKNFFSCHKLLYFSEILLSEENSLDRERFISLGISFKYGATVGTDTDQQRL